MFYISGVQGNMFAVTDTKDGVTEQITGAQLSSYIQQGVKILGVNQTKFGTTVACKSTNVLNDFYKAVFSSLTKLHLLKKDDRDSSIEAIKKQALFYGLGEYMSDITIDLTHKSLVLKKLNKIITWNEEEKEAETINSIDVCDEKVVKLSELGIDAFSHMYLPIAEKKIPLLDLCKEVESITKGDFKYDKIRYIGITPGNKMFKFILDLGRFDTECYSVQFADYATFKKNFDKIKTAKVEKAWGFIPYIIAKERNGVNSPFVVVKMSKKPYTGEPATIYSKIKEKYKTLQDVYKGF